MIDEKQLQEWERLANKATEGPWYEKNGSIVNDDFPILRPVISKFMSCKDAEFIAAARVAVPQLIAEVRALEGELKEEKKRNERLVWHVNEVNQLEKEADWLASNLANESFCFMGHTMTDGCVSDGSCAKCWRETARREVNK